MTVRVAVDALGGDRGPEAIVEGALEAAAAGVEPILFGPAGLDTKGLELVTTTQEIAMDEKPAEAVRSKPDSSLVAACRAVGERRADAVVSAGNTGAMLAACLVELRRLPGVIRPAIAAPLPAIRGVSVLIDSGANADARPEHLLQFGYMGSIFAEEILGIARPSVRLLSIGEEPEKGNQLTLEAHELLAASDLRFEGNTESRDLLSGAADVVVCDGFTGNIALKLMEGTIKTFLTALREESMRTPARKGRRPADSGCRPRPPQPPRPGHLRRRISARPERAGRDRARQLVPSRDRKRDRACRARRGARRRRTTGRQISRASPQGRVNIGPLSD